jgi:hypothetical protein
VVDERAITEADFGARHGRDPDAGREAEANAVTIK